MICQRCSSIRVARVCAKCSDMCSVSINKTNEVDGCVPEDIGIGGGDYVEFSWCLDCGQIQGKFPMPISEQEKDITDNDVIDFFDNHFSEGEKLSFLNKENLINAANFSCIKFGNFIKEFFYYNTYRQGLPIELKSLCMPSSKEFLRRYVENKPGLIDY